MMYAYAILASLFLTFCATSAFAFISRSKRDERAGYLFAFTATLIAAIAVLLVYFMHGFTLRSYAFCALCISISILSTGMALGYNRRMALVIFTAAVIVTIISALQIGYILGPRIFDLPIGIGGIGFAIGLIYRSGMYPKEDRSTRSTKTEVNRDFLQIIIGMIAIAIIAYVGVYAYLIFMVGAILYAINGMSNAGKGRLYSLLHKLERNDVEFGRGAAYLAAGAMIIVGFSSHSFAFFGISALVLGDAIATISGIMLYKSRRLPHNKRKTYAGTFAFFIISAIAGLLTIGFLSVPIAAILAIVESIELPIDDNILIPVIFLALELIVISVA